MSKMPYPDSLWECHFAAAEMATREDTPWTILYNQDQEPIGLNKGDRTLIDLEPTFRTEVSINLVKELLNKFCRRGWDGNG